MIPELLAPAGSLEKLKVAVTYGADAVYLGGRHFSLRSGAGNFDDKEMAEGIRFAHQKGARVYVTVNIFARNRDLVTSEYFHGFILQGWTGLSFPTRDCRSGQANASELAVHLSTGQYHKLAASSGKAVFQDCAGRSSLEESGNQRAVELDLEVFVHGAMVLLIPGAASKLYLAGRTPTWVTAPSPAAGATGWLKKKTR